MQKANRSGLRKKAAATVALLVVLATAVGGTLAYQDYKQHKSNELSGSQIKYEARLVEDFEEVFDWKVGEDIKKEIRVANVGKAEAGYGDVYVRLQLKEFMQIGDIIIEETPERYMVANGGLEIVTSGGTFTFEDGHYVIFPSELLAKEAFPNNNVKYLTDAVTKETGWFIETKAGDFNGQYGKHVVTKYGFGDMEPVIPGSVFCPEDQRNHHGIKDPVTGEYDVWSLECNYPIHTWDDPDGPEYRAYIKQYIKWVLGEDIIFIDEWDGKPVAAWIIDDADPNGWAYWGQALAPETSTSNILEKVLLINQPDGNFYYCLHVDMQALSIDEFLKDDGEGKDWNNDVKDSYVKNRPTIKLTNLPDPATVKVGETLQPPTVTVGPEGAAQGPLTWTSSRPGIATVDQNGVVTGVAVGQATIIVTAPNGARGQYTVTVTPGDPVVIPAESVKINGGDRNKTVGQSETLTITKNPGDTTDIPVWSSDNPCVTVDQNGKITAVAPGEANITVELRPGVTDTIKVTVTAAAPDELPLQKGEGPYEAQVTDDDDFRMFLKLKRSTFTVTEMYNPCAIKLADILAASYGSDYSGITVEAANGALNEYFTIGKDKSGTDDAILCTYIGVKADWEACVEAANGDWPSWEINLVLKKAGFADTPIKVIVGINPDTLYFG